MESAIWAIYRPYVVQVAFLDKELVEGANPQGSSMAKCSKLSSPTRFTKLSVPDYYFVLVLSTHFEPLQAWGIGGNV
jgi:hypothetical protein